MLINILAGMTTKKMTEWSTGNNTNVIKAGDMNVLAGEMKLTLKQIQVLPLVNCAERIWM